MTEQELRAAVAEYDAEMARKMKMFVNAGTHLLYEPPYGVTWKITTHEGVDEIFIKRYEGFLKVFTSEFSIESVAQNMRAMDAAALAFNEALNGEAK